MTEALKPCNCISMCRVLAESLREPHSPSCPNFRGETFIRISANGTSCIIEPGHVADFVDGGEYTMTEVVMSRAAYESLPEFEGF